MKFPVDVNEILYLIAWQRDIKTITISMFIFLWLNLYFLRYFAEKISSAGAIVSQPEESAIE